MGRAVPKKQYLRCERENYVRPLVFCCELDGITNNAIPMNLAIARRLTEIPPSMWSMRLESCFVSVLKDLPEGVVIRDFDVLFNPAYEVDVMALLCSAHRKRCFNLVWPGRYEGNRFLYAEEGCLDYKTYDIDRYDITCIY